MLSDRDLLLKKQMLQLRSAHLRLQMRQQVQASLGPAVRSVERVHRASLWVRERPLLVGGVLLALAVWQPARVVQWAGRGLWLWQTLQRLQAPRDPPA